MTGRGGVRQVPSFGSNRPVNSGCRGSGRSCTAAEALLGRGLVEVREAHALHGVQVIQVAPEFLEAVRRRQRIGVVAQMVLAELAGGVAKIVQELGEGRRAGPQIGNGLPGSCGGIMPCAADACR